MGDEVIGIADLLKNIKDIKFKISHYKSKLKHEKKLKVVTSYVEQLEDLEKEEQELKKFIAFEEKIRVMRKPKKCERLLDALYNDIEEFEDLMEEEHFIDKYLQTNLDLTSIKQEKLEIEKLYEQELIDIGECFFCHSPIDSEKAKEIIDKS
jgi:hypothetical protein